MTLSKEELIADLRHLVNGLLERINEERFRNSSVISRREEKRSYTAEELYEAYERGHVDGVISTYNNNVVWLGEMK
jgi:hypothetical protein